jgi:hypothetical protein
LSGFDFLRACAVQRYFFDVTNGHRLADPSGLECEDDGEAMTYADFIAQQIALELVSTAGRQVAVRNSGGREIGTVSIDDRINQGSEDGGQ